MRNISKLLCMAVLEYFAFIIIAIGPHCGKTNLCQVFFFVTNAL